MMVVLIQSVSGCSNVGYRTAYAIIARPVVVPSCRTIDETGGVKTSDKIREAKLGIAVNHLAPTFVVDYLKCLLVTIITWKFGLNLLPMYQC